MSKMLDLTSQTFNRLRVLEMSDRDEKNFIRWLCYCDPQLGGCGGSIITRTRYLRSGDVGSCGCLEIENRKKWWKSRTIHGEGSKLRRSRIYRIWHRVKSACYSPRHHNFKYYGGRGITVCNEWLLPKGQGFLNFYNWAMSNGYKEDLTIDRIDVNGNYCPENCRWATKIEQANNTRTNKFITVFGTTITIAEAFRKYAHKTLTYPAVLGRVRLGWNSEIALITPLNSKGRKSGL